MFKDYTKVSLLLLFSCSFGSLLAQETISPIGGNATGSGGTASYTIGQTAYSHNSGVGGTSSEGVQQAFEISVLTGNNTELNDLQLTIYPNPTTDELVLSTGNLSLSNVRYQLFNENGISLKDQVVSDNTTHIDVSGLNQAIYILKVTNQDQELKTFKIVKL